MNLGALSGVNEIALWLGANNIPFAFNADNTQILLDPTAYDAAYALNALIGGFWTNGLIAKTEPADADNVLSGSDTTQGQAGSGADGVDNGTSNGDDAGQQADPANGGQVSDDGQDSGSNSVPPSGDPVIGQSDTDNEQVVIDPTIRLADLKSILDLHGIAYTTTPFGDDGTQETFPVLISQADYDTLVAAIPSAAQLLGNDLQIAPAPVNTDPVTPDTTIPTTTTPVVAVPGTPGSDANLVDGSGSGDGQAQGDGTQAAPAGQPTDPASGTGTGDGGQAAGPTGADDGASDQSAPGTAAGADGTGAGAPAAGSGDAPSGDAGTGTGAQPADNTGGTTPVAPAAPAIPSGPGDAGRALTDTTVNQIVWNLIKDCSDLGKQVVEDVYQYIANMRPGMPMDSQQGVRNQVALSRTIGTLVNRVEGDFGQVFPAVLKLFEHHANGVFAETHRFRFIDDPKNAMPPKDRKAFVSLVHTFVTLAPVAGRQEAAKQISFDKALEAGVNENGKMRIRSFFNK